MGTSTVEVTAIPRVHRGTSPGTPRTTSGDEVVVASCDRAAVPTVQVSDRFPVFLGEETCSCRCISATLMPVLLSQDQLPPFGDPLDQAVPWVSENDPAPRVHDTADFLTRFPGDGPRPVSFAWCGSLSGSVRPFVHGLPQSGARAAARVPAKAVKVCRLCLVGRGGAAPSGHRDEDPPAEVAGVWCPQACPGERCPGVSRPGEVPNFFRYSRLNWDVLS